MPNPVLVVDDDENYRELVVLTLEDGCGLGKVLGFSGGAALLAHLRSDGIQRPALILLDLHMTDVRGLELIVRVRELAPDVPVAFLSGAAAPQERDACLAAGAVAFLQKPVAYPELLARLRDLVRSLPT